MKKNPYFQLILGVIALIFLGVAYAWSLFISPLEDYFGWNRAQTSFIFTLSISFFCLGGILAGFLIKYFNFKKILFFDAILIFVGFFLCSKTTALWQIYVSYGIFVGTSIGIAYNIIISTVNKWFPDKTGFSSGTLLMGYGFGSFLLASLINFLTSTIGWSYAFFYLGIIFFFLLFIVSLLLFQPQNSIILNYSKDIQMTKIEFSPKQMLRSSCFYFYYFWGIMLSSIGLTIIGHVSPISESLDLSTKNILIATACVSITNGISRIIFGKIYDIKGRSFTMKLATFPAFIGTIILIVSLNYSITPLLFIGFTLIAIAYGGSVPCNSAFVKETFGSEHYPKNFGIVTSTGLGASFLGPLVIGYIQSITNSYTIALFILLILSCMAFILEHFIHTKKINLSTIEQKKSCINNTDFENLQNSN